MPGLSAGDILGIGHELDSDGVRKARLVARALVSDLLYISVGGFMGQQEEIKIRVLPRKTEARREDGARTAKRSRLPSFELPQISKRHVFATLAFVAAALAIGLALRQPPQSKEMNSTRPVTDPMVARISRLVQDTKLKEEILRQRRTVENLRSTEDMTPEASVAPSPELSRSYGVQLDSENTADRLYEELHDRPVVTSDNTPDDRINAMLEKNKWINQQERQERIQYVRNFVKTAFERGYEVDLDKNLQVVGVHPITNRRVSLEQVIEKIGSPSF